MCGIAGEFTRSGPADAESVRRMTQALAHRGPDDEGYLFRDQVGLGFRRLSILDLHGGHQPMYNEDGRFCIVFNGEIYNYRELVPLLSGHTFRTRSDTEVILHLFEERGADAFGLLNGMFALAIYDARDRRLWCARDRFGQKPFHYYYNPETGFVFASEIGALRRHAGVPTCLDADMLAFYWFYNYFPAPRSVFRGIRKLPPQSFLTVDARGIREATYPVRSAPREPVALPWPDVVARTDHLLRESVRRHLIADVNVGLFLSGGLDSTAVLKYAVQINPEIAAFSATFTPHISELPHVQQACATYGVRPHVLNIDPVVADIEQALAAYSEPFGDSACVSTYLLSGLAARGVKAVLTGEGGDEVFGGYPEYCELLKSTSGPAPPRETPSGSREAEASLKTRYLRARSFCTLNDLEANYCADPAALRAHLTELRLGTPEDVLQHEQSQRLAENHFTKIDVAGMAHGLEARCPFLDHSLVDFVNALPLHYKVTPHDRKLILKELLRRDLPADFIDRPKWGFGAPVEAWMTLPRLRERLAAVFREEEENLKRLVRPHHHARLLRRLDAPAAVSIYYEHWKVFALLVWLRANGIRL